MRFSIRSLLVAILLVGLLCGWVSTSLKVSGIRKRFEQQVTYSKEELARTRTHLEDLLRGQRLDRSRPFWESDLEGTDLTAITIASDRNAFQRASFRNCKLEHAVLKGGTASFQSAKFDDANLKEAKLIGDDASFQGASFARVDLTNASLSRGWGSFDAASFEDATMTGTKCTGGFQKANISGANLQGADLSKLAAESLASCYFDVPPSYDSQTKCPINFDPQEHLWLSVD